MEVTFITLIQNVETKEFQVSSTRLIFWAETDGFKSSSTNCSTLECKFDSLVIGCIYPPPRNSGKCRFIKIFCWGCSVGVLVVTSQHPGRKRSPFHMWGLNSQCFPMVMVGMVINLKGLYTHYKDSGKKKSGGMSSVTKKKPTALDMSKADFLCLGSSGTDSTATRASDSSSRHPKGTPKTLPWSKQWKFHVLFQYP